MPDDLRDVLRGRARLKCFSTKGLHEYVAANYGSVSLLASGFCAGRRSVLERAPQANPGSPAQSKPYAGTAATGDGEPKITVVDATPEDALRTFMLALIAQDEAALRVVTLSQSRSRLAIERRAGYRRDVIKDATAQFAKQPIKRLKEGETFTLPGGKQYVVAASDVGEDKAVLLPAGCPGAHAAPQVKGHWKVVADPFIAGRKADDAAARRPKRKKPLRRSPLRRTEGPGPDAIEPVVRRPGRSSIQPVRVMRRTWSSGPWPMPQAAGASDVHFQPGGDGLELRWRIDGVLHPVALLPAKVAPNVVARLKVLAELLTYRTDVPQEGRIRGVAGRGRDAGQHVPDLVRREGRGPDVRRRRGGSCACRPRLARRGAG